MFSCFLSGLDSDFLSDFSNLPDITEALGLFQSKLVLLYRLGRAGELKQHGLIPADVDVTDVAELVNAAASQNVGFNLPNRAWLNTDKKFFTKTLAIGVGIEILGGSSREDICLCEACVAAIESFLATAFSNKVWPICECLSVLIEISDEIHEPQIDFNPKVMKIVFLWPKRFSVFDANLVSGFGQYLVELCTAVLAAIATNSDLGIS